MSITIKNINDINDFQKLSLSEFSYSRIDTYEMCAAKYFYSYIKKEPRRFNSPAVLGNIVHEVLENTISSEKPLSLSEMKEHYELSKTHFDPNSAISQDLISVGSEIIDEFYDLNQNTIFNVYGKEVGFNFVIGNYSIIGFIDRIDVDGDDVHIVDYKTGKREVAFKDVPTNLQLGIYALAASVMFPGKNITASLHYLRSNRLKSHTYSSEDLDSIKQTLVKRIERIVQDDNFTPTPNERMCSFCDHAESGACRCWCHEIKENEQRYIQKPPWIYQGGLMFIMYKLELSNRISLCRDDKVEVRLDYHLDSLIVIKTNIGQIVNDGLVDCLLDAVCNCCKCVHGSNPIIFLPWWQLFVGIFCFYFFYKV